MKILLPIAAFGALLLAATLHNMGSGARTAEPAPSKSEWRYGKVGIAIINPRHSKGDVVGMFREVYISIGPEWVAGKRVENRPDQVFLGSLNGKFSCTDKKIPVTARFDHGPRLEYLGSCTDVTYGVKIEENLDFVSRIRTAKTLEIQVMQLSPKEYATYEYNVEGYVSPGRRP